MEEAWEYTFVIFKFGKLLVSSSINKFQVL